MSKTKTETNTAPATETVKTPTIEELQKAINDLAGRMNILEAKVDTKMKGGK